jgi:putative transcriptional regulator
MNQNLLEELIVLYLLGELSSGEIEILEREVPKTIQKEFVDSFNSLAYSVPQIKVPQGMKSKILQKIAREEADFVPFRLENLTWNPHPVVKGVDLALLYSDSTRREASYLVRCAPNTNYPSHQHHSLERILILDGEMEIDGEVYHKGDFLLSRPNSIHAPNTPKGCLFYVHTSLDDRFVEWTPAMVWQLLTHRWL